MLNMEYKIQFTEKCLEDIEDACQYIKEKLKEENAANRLRIKIKDSVKGLSISPEMYAKTEKFDRLENEYRRIPIDNYVLLYTVNKKRNTVYIVHFYYGGRNYLEGLIWHVFIKNERKNIGKTLVNNRINWYTIEERLNRKLFNKK